MKRKKINELIEKSGVLGFKFHICSEWHVWYVTLSDGRLIARNILSYWKTVRNYYFDVPYESLSSCDDIYTEIVIDFVDCFAMSWRDLTAGPSGVFRDAASCDDEGLLELLSFFGVNYDEFLLDVLYWYGCWTEAASTTDDLDGYYELIDSQDKRSYSVNKYENHLVKKVLTHIPCTSVVFSFDDGLEESWHLALAHGMLWYGHTASDGHNMWPFEFEDYGRVMTNDSVAISNLRVAILLNVGGESVDCISIYGDDKALTAFDLGVDDFGMVDD